MYEYLEIMLQNLGIYNIFVLANETAQKWDLPDRRALSARNRNGSNESNPVFLKIFHKLFYFYIL